jgi:tetratricopeptide (TPR) repeat protein
VAEHREGAAELAQRAYEAFRSGDTRRSRDLSVEGLDLARAAHDAPAEAEALAGLMRLSLRERDFDELEGLARQAEEAASAAQDPSLRRMPLHMRAEAARMQGDLDKARTLYDASLDLNQELGNEAMVTIEMANKAWVEIHGGNLGEAQRLARASLSRTETDDAYGIAFCLLSLARVALELGDASGVEILGAADAALEQGGIVWDPAEQPDYDATRDLGRRIAGAAFDERVASGLARDARSF